MSAVGADAGSNFVYLSSTAHPAAVLAARDFQMQVRAAVEETSVHSMTHGQKLLREAVFEDIRVAEPVSTQHVTRLLEADVRVVSLVAPGVQPVRYDSVPLDQHWRSGQDVKPAAAFGADFLERVLPRLFASDLARLGVKSPEHGPSPARRNAGRPLFKSSG